MSRLSIQIRICLKIFSTVPWPKACPSESIDKVLRYPARKQINRGDLIASTPVGGGKKRGMLMQVIFCSRGQTPAESDFQILEIVRKLEMYGVRFHPAADREGTKINLAVSHMGLQVFQVAAASHTNRFYRCDHRSSLCC